MNHCILNKSPQLIALSLLFICWRAFSADLLIVKNDLKEQLVVIDATIEAVNKATLSAQTSGRVRQIYFDTNDYVTQGSVILEITNKEQGALLAVAEAEVYRTQALYNEATLTYQRYKKLFPKGAISQGQLDQAEAAAKTNKQLTLAAQANLNKAKESLDYTIIKAPYSGIVTARHVEVGETITPGQPLFSGMSLQKLRAVTEIPQRHLEALRKNPEFIITLNDGSQLVSDKITLFNYADQQSHAFKVRIELPETTHLLLPGMWVKVQFVSGERQSITIPRSAILNNNELNAVYRDVNGKALLTQVRLGTIAEDSVEVLAGLKQGDVISVDAYKKLQQLESK
ncbi:efflux RND transporter periplasmic adaptor subunit [Psychromonas antarctica]|uniref:efflux RND transporter periplasmic adaptor subunit n=1 Tax=Psychromonas antarctica TaxID=67573 RepID=UPI001EE838FB|nr:efflux RND transporter periplasmic adaptor subunit [Psychromonas antarctica]MCG6200399.1 efflux RND transporter periplasmic adaptor subunit [Psychromonas antarctica]